MSITHLQFCNVDLNSEHVLDTNQVKKILEKWRSEQINFYKKDAKNADFVYTPFIETEGGVQLFPKTIFIKSPYVKFKPPQSKASEGVAHITIPDNIFINMNVCVKLLKLLDLINKPQFSNESVSYEKIKCVTNYKKFDPHYIKHVDNLYNSIFTSPLNYFSIEKQMQGKNNILRSWNLGKRIRMTARATIVPSASDAPLDSLFLPRSIHAALKYPQYVLTKRDPSLCEEAFSFFKVALWDNNCFGFPAEYLKNNGGDYDGDEVLIMPVTRLTSLAECLTLCSARYNMRSNTSFNFLKLYPVEDTFIYFYFALRFKKELKLLRSCFPEKLHFEDNNVRIWEKKLIVKNCVSVNKTLCNLLVTICDLFGSEICFSAFEKLRQFTIKMNRLYAMSFNVEEIYFLKNIASKKSLSDFLEWFSEYEESPQDYCCIQIKSGGVKATAVHLYQMIGRDFGGVCTFFLKPNQVFKNAIVGNFFDGLTPSSFWKHCQISIDNYVSSRYIGPLGYEDIKIKFSLQDVEVNYLYNLQIKNKVFIVSPCDYIEPERILPPDTFASIVQMSSRIESHGDHNNK